MLLIDIRICMPITTACVFSRENYFTMSGRVGLHGVKSLGGHFACLCRGFEFYEVKYTFPILVFKKSKIAQIYYYDLQSAGINLQSPQSDSTPWTLTLV